MVEITAAYETKDLLLNQNSQHDKFNKINSELATLKNMMKEISISVDKKEYQIPIKLEKYEKQLIENGVEYYIARSNLKKLIEQINFENKDDKIY